MKNKVSMDRRKLYDMQWMGLTVLTRDGMAWNAFISYDIALKLVKVRFYLYLCYSCILKQFGCLDVFKKQAVSSFCLSIVVT